MYEVIHLDQISQLNLSRWLKQALAKRAFVYVLCVFICALAILLKFDGQLPSPGQTLWAEDGPVFLHDANHYGPAALFKPYAGYLHVYPRLTSLIAAYFTIATQPTILLCGWIIAIIIFLFALTRVFTGSKYWELKLTSATFLVMFQPSGGETFLNITNSQWILGAALFLICLSTSKDSSITRWVAFAVSAPLSLTGPFSVVLLPVIFLKLIFIKDWQQNKYIYTCVILGSIVQVYFLMTGNRAGGGELETDLTVWIESALKILLLGSGNTFQYILILAFWGIIIYKLIAGLSLSAIKVAVLFVSAAVLMIIAGLMSHSHNPSAILAMGSGNRYTWVPYTLIVVAAFLAADSDIKKVGLYAILLFIVFATSFRSIYLRDTFFYSYAAFRSVKNITIPINPGVEVFPGWHIPEDTNFHPSQPSLSYINYPVDGFDAGNLVNPDPSKGNFFDALTNDPSLVMREPLTCESSGHIGISIAMNRSVQGWAQVFFSSDTYFSEAQSFRRWYPSGKVVAEFAFPYLKGGVFLRIDPAETPNPVVVESVKLYCLQ
jgi:hypothetical protein